MRTITARILSVFLALSIALPCSVFLADSSYAAKDNEDDVSIIFTTDINAQDLSGTITKGEEKVTGGGFARIKTASDKIKEEYPNSFLFDGGNFSMGTAFQSIFATEAPELSLMSEIGYDVVGLGSSEFAAGMSSLASMLSNAASKNGVADTAVDSTATTTTTTTTTTAKTLPQIVVPNVNWKAITAKKTKASDAASLKSSLNSINASDYTVVRKNGVDIAVFSVVGNKAGKAAESEGVIWENETTRAQEIVDEINRNGEADIIVCMTHSSNGTDSNSLDKKLAGSVKGIDLIISGNNTKATEKQVKKGDTTIVSCVPNGGSLGHVVFTKSGDEYKFSKFESVALDSSVKEDSGVQSKAGAYTSSINSSYFSNYGYSYTSTVGKSDFDFTPAQELGTKRSDDPLGDIVAKGYEYGVRSALGDGSAPEVTFVSAGAITGSISAGDLTAESIFKVCSSGQGFDGSTAVPLVQFYLSGKELKALAEADASLADDNNDLRYFFSGLNYSYNTHRVKYNKAYGFSIVDANGNASKINKDTMYRVVCDAYTFNTLKDIGEDSDASLSVKPKGADGQVTDDASSLVLKNGSTEIKGWSALSSYIASMGTISEAYKEPLNTKNDKTSFNPFSLFREMNRFAVTMLLVVVIPILIIIGVVLFLRHRKHERRGYKKSMFGSASKARNNKKHRRGKGFGGTRRTSFSKASKSSRKRKKSTNRKWKL